MATAVAIEGSGRDIPPEAGVWPAVREALACVEQEWHDEAILACEKALKLEPACAEAIFLLGLVTFDLDEPVQAIGLLEKAHAIDPTVQEFAEALAATHARLGNVTDSLFYAKVATTLAPHPIISGLLPERFGTFFSNLETGYAFRYRDRAERKLATGNFAEAAEDCRRQLDLTPGDSASLRIMARACLGSGQIERSTAAFHAVLHGGEATAEDMSGMARALSAGGRHDEAMACHRTAVELASERSGLQARLHSLLLADLLRRRDVCAAQLLQAHSAWQARHTADIVPRPLPTDRDPDPERPLRVGYISGAFAANDLMQLFAPVLKAHRKEQVRTYCYAEGARVDATSENLMRAADKWTDITGIDDETVWQILRGDEIDLLVDLAGHTEGGRPLVLARRPAPVALSWLGYPHAPGVAAVDHILTDGTAWPERHAKPMTGEHVWRLPRASFAYRAPALLPPVSPLPALQAGHLTIGVSGDLGLIDAASAALWAGVLRAIEGARLLVCNRFEQDQVSIDRCLELFCHLGLRDRVDVVNMAENFQSEFDFYRHVDLALDTSPSGAVVEDCRALWMGVPVLTLAGDRQATRLGASLLTAAGHPEWTAETPENLAAVAGELASDLGRLRDLRARLRGHVGGSALADVAGFVRDLEQAYRAMWQARMRQQA